MNVCLSDSSPGEQKNLQVERINGASPSLIAAEADNNLLSSSMVNSSNIGTRCCVTRTQNLPQAEMA